MSVSGQALHGGTDSSPEPQYDFSSNANFLGPCPSVLAAVRGADFTRYPDPRYAQLRETLARHHGTTPGRIVVGAGASELILRLIDRVDGAVRQLGPTFSEYARAARLLRRRLISVRSPRAFLQAQNKHPGLGFVCWPNNPTGDAWPLDFVHAAAAAGPLVVDLAYAPLCDGRQSAAIEAAAAGAYRLYSPNKSVGLTGVRGAYVITPRNDLRLAAAAPSWVIGRDGVAMLTAAIAPQALAWLSRTVPQLHHARATLATALRELDIDVKESPASYLMARVGDAHRVAAAMRNSHDVRVRDASSFGLPEWIRLSAQSSAAQRALLAALKRAT